MAEFDDPTSLVDGGAKRTYDAGYREIDTFSPYPIHEAWEAIGQHDTRAVDDRARRRASPGC